MDVSCITTVDSILTSRCSFISQHIWITICIVLAILRRFIESKIFSTGKGSMSIFSISGRQIDALGKLNLRRVTGLGRWCSGQRLLRLWSRPSASVGRRCTCSFASAALLWILCSAMCQGRYPAVWFWRSIAGCLSIATFTILCPGNWTPYIVSSWTMVWGLLIDFEFPLMRYMKTLLWPFWPYWRPGACRTVPAVPNLLALP